MIIKMSTLSKVVIHSSKRATTFKMAALHFVNVTKEVINPTGENSC